jgi:hypothetical protein
MENFSNTKLFVLLLSSAVLLKWAYHFAQTWAPTGGLELVRAGRPIPPGIKPALQVLYARLLFSLGDLIFGPPPKAMPLLPDSDEGSR